MNWPTGNEESDQNVFSRDFPMMPRSISVKLAFKDGTKEDLKKNISCRLPHNILYCRRSNIIKIEPSWLWSYGSWINNELCKQWLLLLTLWVRIPFRRGVLDTTLCDTGYQWLAAGLWLSFNILVFSINKTNRHDITDILLKMVLNTVNLKL